MTIEINPCEAYTNLQPRYKRVRDIVEGEYRLKEVDLRQAQSYVKSIKDTNLVSPNYLRYINPQDRSPYNLQRNIGFINGARLFNATSRTLTGLMGMLFRVYPSEPELNSEMDYIFDNVDGSGLSLNQQAQSAAWNVIQVGRHGLLTDMPRNDDGIEITRAVVKNGFRPNIQEYTAENIIDWNESVVNGSKVLDLVVLREESCEFCADRIKREKREIMRVYRLKDGAVTVQIYTQQEDKGFKESKEITVTISGGAPLDHIPFSFVGSVNNTPDPDLLPLEPLTDANLGHYQESANLRSSSYQLSAAQGVIADDNYARAAANAKDNSIVQTGEDSFIVLGSGGSFGFYSPDPNNISSDLMAKDEERMVALGAQLVVGSGQAETAEAARIKRSSDVSVLESIAMNISMAYTGRIQDAYLFMGVVWDEPKYNLNRDFFDSKLTAQEITAIIASWQAGAISKKVLDKKLQEGKVIAEDVDLEEMNEEIEEEQELQGGVDFDDESQNIDDAGIPGSKKEEPAKSKSPTAKTEE